MAVEERWLGAGAVARFLSERAGVPGVTLLLPPGGPLPDLVEAPWCREALLEGLSRWGAGETGVALFLRPQEVLAVVPPVPLDGGEARPGWDPIPLLRLLERPWVLGLVLLRRGRYAVGLVRGRDLVAHKTGSRYVHSGHAAGGWSQARFARRRGKQVEDLLEEVCAVLTVQWGPEPPERVFFGGERTICTALQRRCPLFHRLEGKVARRMVPVREPGYGALKDAVAEAWKSRVVRLTPPAIGEGGADGD